MWLRAVSGGKDLSSWLRKGGKDYEQEIEFRQEGNNDKLDCDNFQDIQGEGLMCDVEQLLH